MTPLRAGLLAAGLLALVGTAALPAQEKKEQPKKKERIAINEPKDAAKDPDFAIQGEYEGKSPAGEKVGVQVIAQGLGKFAVKAYKGGLPGDGADPKDTLTGTAETKDGKTTATMKLGAETSTATIGNGAFVVDVGDKKIELKRVERKSKTLGEKPPQGAVVLFGAEGDEKNWDGGKLVELSDGKFLNMGIKSKQKFGAFKAHVEFRLPWMPNSTGQGRANSGVYLQDRYELQVLDSFGLSGENNECGGIYQQYKPLVNMCYPPMVWQTYDIEFTPAEFDQAGKKTKAARATIYHNGVKIHDNIEFKGPTGGGQKEEATPGPFQLQNHGDPLVYRNA
ncbi:MAG: DUF1080 domain-containing protein, partial [Gemmataceae bacterium]|nr:DUF1080 domain-containing protein [Gemmataceae bacterium]